MPSVLGRQTSDALNELIAIVFRQSDIRHKNVRFPVVEFFKRTYGGIHRQRFGAIPLEDENE